MKDEATSSDEFLESEPSLQAEHVCTLQWQLVDGIILGYCIMVMHQGEAAAAWACHEKRDLKPFNLA